MHRKDTRPIKQIERRDWFDKPDEVKYPKHPKYPTHPGQVQWVHGPANGHQSIYHTVLQAPLGRDAEGKEVNLLRCLETAPHYIIPGTQWGPHGSREFSIAKTEFMKAMGILEETVNLTTRNNKVLEVILNKVADQVSVMEKEYTANKGGFYVRDEKAFKAFCNLGKEIDNVGRDGTTLPGTKISTVGAIIRNVNPLLGRGGVS